MGDVRGEGHTNDGDMFGKLSHFRAKLDPCSDGSLL